MCDEVVTPYTGPTSPPNASSPPVPSVIEVPVAVHVITKADGTGFVSKATIDQQIALFDAAFTSPSPGLPSYDFKLIALTYTEDDDYHTLTDGNPPDNSNAEFVEATNAISMDPSRVLNFYILDYSHRGRGSMPTTYPTQDDPGDGVFVDYKVLPGGSDTSYNDGDVAIHEVGHYLGLYHTFHQLRDEDLLPIHSPQEICMEDPGTGDIVSDTSPHLGPQGCPVTFNTCLQFNPQAGVPPVENYMNVQKKQCLMEFTAGQFTRMRDEAVAGRPSLVYTSWDEVFLTDDLVIGANQTYTFYDVDVRVGLFAGVQVLGELNAEGTTFTESSIGQGWGGIRYEQGSTGLLQDATVELVNDQSGSSPSPSVYVHNADPIFEGVIIQDGTGDGLFVTGSGADVTMRSSSNRQSEILRHTQQNGVVSASGADVTLDRVRIQESGLSGVYATNGADVFMHVSTVDDSQQGAAAYFNGRVLLGRPGQNGIVTGQNNLLADSQISTLSTQYGATVYGGGSGISFDSNYRNNWLRLNSGNPNQKHATIGYADVIAECNYWDEPTGPDPARVFIGGYGVFDGSPFLYDPPAISLTCGTTPPQNDITTGGDTFARRTDAGIEGAKDDSTEEGGPPKGMSEDRWLAIVEGAENPDLNVGIGHAVNAIQSARTDFDAQRAFDVAAQLGRNEAHPGLEGFLHAQSRTRKHGGYAHAALAEIYYGTGRHDEARATTKTLTTEYAGTDHARRGWLTLYAVAQDAGDFAEADAALAAVHAGWPGHETEVLGRALALAREGDRVERGGVQTPSTPRTAAPSVQAFAVDETVPTTTELRAPYPNPTASGVTVPLALARDAEVTLWLVNTLG